jgi:hypothetical protein
MGDGLDGDAGMSQLIRRRQAWGGGGTAKVVGRDARWDVKGRPKSIEQSIIGDDGDGVEKGTA